MKKNKRSSGRSIRKRRLIVIIFLSFTAILQPFSLLAGISQQQQTYQIKGIVTDDKGVPLAGVSIRIENTMLGVISDLDGHFVLLVSGLKGNLIFSFVGYKTQKQPIEKDKDMRVKLTEDIARLDEVKVVAYGTQKTREITGAITSIKAADFEGIVAPDMQNLMQGQMAGVNMMNGSGDAGGRKILNIRGTNGLAIENLYSDPLFVIDGVPVYSFTSGITGLNTLAEIDPNTIESIEVLKDAASSSLYGSRAANGVVLIKTKKGRLNQKPVFKMTYSHTWESDPYIENVTGGASERRTRMVALNDYSETIYDEETNTYIPVTDYWTSYMNGVEYGYFWGKGEGRRLRIYQDSLNPFYNNSTNMNDYIFQKGKIDRANISVIGGASNVSYNTGIGWYSEDGSVRKTGFDRINLEAGLSIQPYRIIETSINFYVSHTKRKKSPDITGDFINNEGLAQIPLEVDGSTLLPGPGTPAFERKMARLNKTEEKNQSNRLRTNFDLAVKPGYGFKLKSIIAVDYTQQKQHSFSPAELSEYNEPRTSFQEVENMMLLNENTISWEKSFNEQHNFNALFGLSFQTNEEIRFRSSGATSSDRIKWVNDDDLVYDSDNARIVSRHSGTKDRSSLFSTFAYLNYNYKGKYLLSFTFRRDGSSKFGEDVKYGNFPSVSLGYILTDEPFMESWKSVLSFLKIRASIGKSGNTPRQSYIPFGILEPKGSFLGHATIGPFWQEGLSNRNLTWEKTTQYNFGLDFTLLEHRINVMFDTYRRNTKDGLATVAIPSNTSGYYWHWINGFGVRNSGVELTVKWDILNTDKLHWKFSFNAARNWNKLLSTYNNKDFQTTGNFGTFEHNINIIGQPLNQIMAYDTKGYYTSQDQVPYIYINDVKTPLGTSSQIYRPGDIRLVDHNGNNSISANYPINDDRVTCGSAYPIIQGGWSTSITYRKFDFSLLFNYVIGRHILNATKGSSIGTIMGITQDDIAKKFSVKLSDIHYWEEDKTNINAPANRLEAGLNSFNTYTSANVENASFMRLKNIMLGYTYQPKSSKIRIHIYLSGENWMMLTNYSGRDPEAVDPNTGCDDGKTYPLAPKTTLGIDMTF